MAELSHKQIAILAGGGLAAYFILKGKGGLSALVPNAKRPTTTAIASKQTGGYNGLFGPATSAISQGRPVALSSPAGKVTTATTGLAALLAKIFGTSKKPPTSASPSAPKSSSSMGGGGGGPSTGTTRSVSKSASPLADPSTFVGPQWDPIQQRLSDPDTFVGPTQPPEVDLSDPDTFVGPYYSPPTDVDLSDPNTFVGPVIDENGNPDFDTDPALSTDEGDGDWWNPPTYTPGSDDDPNYIYNVAPDDVWGGDYGDYGDTSYTPGSDDDPNYDYNGDGDELWPG